MARSYFDRCENLQIHGDVNFIFTDGSMQDDQSFFQINQRAQATNTHSRTFERGLKILCNNTAPSAQYGFSHSFVGPQCHPGTRIAVQDHIFKWLDDKDGPIAMWMNGPVGIGKSAIAQTVAHLAAEREQLSSAFFFFRSDEARNSAKHLVATLAYEMAQQMPHTLDQVCQNIGAHPLIFSSTLEHQINTTLLRPLCSPAPSFPGGNMLIIIDGLDECLDTSTQLAIIRSFILGFIRAAAGIIPHKILIVSRPESQIVSAFSVADISPHVRCLALDLWNTEDDIGTFLRAKLDEINQSHPLRHYLPGVWPAEDPFCRLRQQSIGSFAYASAAVRHLASHDHNPERALRELLSLQPSQTTATTFAELDTLYRHILLSLNPDMLLTLRKVLCLHVYLSRSAIDALASLLSEERSIVEIALIRASSLIQIYNCGENLKFYHSSFEEFLWDKERSGDLYLYSANVASAAAAALSSLWLHPISDRRSYELFECMTSRLDFSISTSVRNDPRVEDMNVHVVNTFVATKLPTSFLSDEVYDHNISWHATLIVADFCQALRWKSRSSSESTHRKIYTRAFDVVCIWLRSGFDLFFHGTPTTKNVLDILLKPESESLWRHPFIGVFKRLTTADSTSFDCLRCVFPVMSLREVYSEITHRYLALSVGERKRDMAGPMSGVDISLTMLYITSTNGLKIEGFCQILEQMVMEGMRSLGPLYGVYLTPRDCIFRFFHGPGCYIDSDYQLATAKGRVSDIVKNGWPPEKDYLSLAEKTDKYIRQTHMEQDFPYISEDVLALYRASSPTPPRI